LAALQAEHQTCGLPWVHQHSINKTDGSTIYLPSCSGSIATALTWSQNTLKISGNSCGIDRQHHNGQCHHHRLIVTAAISVVKKSHRHHHCAFFFQGATKKYLLLMLMLLPLPSPPVSLQNLSPAGLLSAVTACSAAMQATANTTMFLAMLLPLLLHCWFSFHQILLLFALLSLWLLVALCSFWLALHFTVNNAALVVAVALGCSCHGWWLRILFRSFSRHGAAVKIAMVAKAVTCTATIAALQCCSPLLLPQAAVQSLWLVHLSSQLLSYLVVLHTSIIFVW